MESLSDQKPFDWKKYSDIAVRRRWYLLGPFFGVGILAFAVALFWPPVYRSEAMIQVEEQKVPQKYVTPNVVSDIDSRLQSMTQQILSRTRLESLIKQFNLYSKKRSRTTMDDLVDQMRQDIAIQVAPGAARDDQTTSFRISFSAENPLLAQQINNELTSMFIEKSLESRAQESLSTTNFLQSQLEQAHKDLEKQEEELRQYKMRYLGELPEQEQSNLQILNSLQVQLQSITDSIGRAEQQKIYLQSLRSEYRVMEQSSADAPQGGETYAGGGSEGSIGELKRQLAELEAKYTPQHPDVLRVKEEIAKWESLHKSATDTTNGKEGTPTTAGADTPNQPALAEVESRLKAVDVEIANDKAQAEKVRKQITDLQTHLSLTPVREQQLSEVTRNYQNSREYYQSLLQKSLESELATNLEKRQEGEQFRIIDPPSLPDKPFKPNRPLILLGGWALGLCLGVCAAGLREFQDGSIRNEKEIREQTVLPILVRIPILLTVRGRKSKRIRWLIEIAVIAIFTLISIAVAIYTHRLS